MKTSPLKLRRGTPQQIEVTRLCGLLQTVRLRRLHDFKSPHLILTFGILLVVLHGTVSSQTRGSSVRSSQLATAIKSYNRDELLSLTKRLSPSPESSLADGILLSWDGRSRAATDKLADALRHRDLLSSVLADEAERYLALDESLEQQYEQAFEVGTEFLHHQHILRGNDLSDFKDQVSQWHSLRGGSIMTVEGGAARFPLLANDTGRLETNLDVSNNTVLALFDTGAELSVINRSTFERLMLRPLSGRSQDTGSTGAVADVQLAILPTLVLGSCVIHNMPVLVEEDKALRVGPPGHQSAIDMIIGYPVMRKLSSLAVEDGGFLILNEPAQISTRKAKLLEVGPTLVIIAQLGDQIRAFLLDTGATKTVLTAKFFEQEAKHFSEAQSSYEQFSGIGGSKTSKRYTLPSFDLQLAQGSVELRNITVLPASSALDVQGLFGNMGRDLWNDSRFVFIDFKDLTISF